MLNIRLVNDVQVIISNASIRNLEHYFFRKLQKKHVIMLIS